jgi:hypothetical protein
MSSQEITLSVLVKEISCLGSPRACKHLGNPFPFVKIIRAAARQLFENERLKSSVFRVWPCELFVSWNTFAEYEGSREEIENWATGVRGSDKRPSRVRFISNLVNFEAVTGSAGPFVLWIALLNLTI